MVLMCSRESCSDGTFYKSYGGRGADPVPEAPTRVRSGEGNNRSKVLSP
jgi:hypothetical protein